MVSTSDRILRWVGRQVSRFDGHERAASNAWMASAALAAARREREEAERALVRASAPQEVQVRAAR